MPEPGNISPGDEAVDADAGNSEKADIPEQSQRDDNTQLGVTASNHSVRSAGSDSRILSSGDLGNLTEKRGSIRGSRDSMVATEGAATTQLSTVDSSHSNIDTPATSRRKASLLQRIKKQKLGSKESGSDISPAVNRRAPQGWRAKWMTSSYTSKNEEFHKLFGEFLLADEILIDDYACALQKDILQQGRLYVSHEHVCFHANIFGFETKIAVRWENVQALTREKTVLLFPNAMQITVVSPNADDSDTKQYFFSSFVRRELSHEIMMKVWQNKLLGEPETPAELRRFVCERYGIEWQGSDGEEDEDEEDVGDSEAKESREDLAAVDGDISDAAGSGSESSDCSLSGEPLGPIQCSCSSHVDTPFIDENFNIPIDQLHDMFFVDGQPSAFMSSWVEERKLLEYSQPPWTETDSADTVRTRTLTYVMPMEIKLGPKTSFTTEMQLVRRAVAGEEYRVEVDVSNAGVPYADAFYSHIEYCMTRVSKSSSHLRIAGCIKFRKSLFSVMKNMIERSAADGMKTHHERLREALLQECQAGRTSPANNIPQVLPASRSHSRRPSLGAAPKPASRPNFHRGVSTVSAGTITGVTCMEDMSSKSTAAPPRFASGGSYVNIFTVVLLLLNFLLLVCIYLREPTVLLADQSLHQTLLAQWRRDSAGSEHLGIGLGTPEEWRSLLQLQHGQNRMEMERTRRTLTTISTLIDKIRVALEASAGLAPLNPSSNMPGKAPEAKDGTCSGDSCPGSPGVTLQNTIDSLVLLQQEQKSRQTVT